MDFCAQSRTQNAKIIPPIKIVRRQQEMNLVGITLRYSFRIFVFLRWEVASSAIWRSAGVQLVFLSETFWFCCYLCTGAGNLFAKLLTLWQSGKLRPADFRFHTPHWFLIQDALAADRTALALPKRDKTHTSQVMTAPKQCWICRKTILYNFFWSPIRI